MKGRMSNSKKIMRQLVKMFEDKFSIKNFVETGTYYGATSLWASEMFENVYTIEASRKIFNSIKVELKTKKNIHTFCGKSYKLLLKICKNLKGSTLFWLDAHWSGGDTYGRKEECPLLREVMIIKKYIKYKSYVLIDDARLFMFPPPKPHNPEEWPSLNDVLTELNRNGEMYIVIANDIIIAVPMSKRKKALDLYSTISVCAPFSTTTLYRSIELLKKIPSKLNIFH